MYVYCCALFLAMCLWVDVELPEEPQYQYPEQPPPFEQFEQQEQYEIVLKVIGGVHIIIAFLKLFLLLKLPKGRCLLRVLVLLR